MISLKTRPLDNLPPGAIMQVMGEIRVGSVVGLMDAGSNMFLLTPIPENEATLYTGPRYRVEKGSQLEKVRFILLDQNGEPVATGAPMEMEFGQAPDAPAAPAPKENLGFLNPNLPSAVKAVLAHDDVDTRRSLYLVLQQSVLLIPTGERPAGLAPGAQGSTFSVATSMSLPAITNAAGQVAVAGFTDSDAYQNGTRLSDHCIGLRATDFFSFVLQQTNAEGVLLNPGCADSLLLSRTELGQMLRQAEGHATPTRTRQASQDGEPPTKPWWKFW
jgi:hypothetical protein